MKENDVTYFSTLLNIDAEAVKGAAEDGSLGEKITALGMTSKADVEELKTNLTQQVRNTYLSELEESAKKGELPQELYKPINGAVLEKQEKKLAKEYGVTEYDGFDDLVAKAIKNTAKPDDTKAQELLEKIGKLQEANTNLVAEKEDAVKAVKEEFNQKSLSRELTDYINRVPFDFSDVEEKDLDSVTAERREILKSVFESQNKLAYNDDKITVFQDDKPLLVEHTLAPVPISDVLRKTASKLGMKLKSPDTGGQGGSSSGGNGSATFKDVEEYNALCKAKGIGSTSAEGLKIWAERKPK